MTSQKVSHSIDEVNKYTSKEDKRARILLADVLYRLDRMEDLINLLITMVKEK